MRRDTRATFAATVADLVEEDLSVALVYAEISGQLFGDVERRHPERVVNVGIREQLLVNVGAGIALTGMRPVVHTFASFLVERAFEQVKLGFSHQDVGGVLVGSGGSYDISGGGRTHQAPGDVALMDTLPDWTIHVPGHADEVEAALRLSVAGSGRDYVRVTAQQNRQAFPVSPGRFHLVRRGSGATVVAVGPMLDPVLEAVADLDVTVLYASTVRPFDARSLRAVLGNTGGRPRRAVPRRNLRPLRGGRARRRTAPSARPRRRSGGAAQVRQAGRPRGRARAGRGRDPALGDRVPGGLSPGHAEGRGGSVGTAPPLAVRIYFLNASLTFSPACLRSDLLWSFLPSASREWSLVASPSFSLALPRPLSAECFILSSIPMRTTSLVGVLGVPRPRPAMRPSTMFHAIASSPWGGRRPAWRNWQRT